MSAHRIPADLLKTKFEGGIIGLPSDVTKIKIGDYIIYERSATASDSASGYAVGAIHIDTDNGVVKVNTGSTSSTTWSTVTVS